MSLANPGRVAASVVLLYGFQNLLKPGRPIHASRYVVEQKMIALAVHACAAAVCLKQSLFLTRESSHALPL